MVNEKKFPNKIISFPKPNQKGQGATVQFSIAPDKECVFMTIARQKKETSVKDARFNYEEKEVIKLSHTDMGEFIAVISSICSSLNDGKGLYHEYNDSKSSIKFNINDPKKYDKIGFFLDVSKNGTSAKMPITTSEAMQIKIMFEEAIRLYYNWGEKI